MKNRLRRLWTALRTDRVGRVSRWRVARDWWIAEFYDPWRLKRAHWRVIRSREDGHFLIVYYSARCDDFDALISRPYYFVVSCLTYRGAKKAIRSELNWERLVDHLGPEGMRQVMKIVGSKLENAMPPPKEEGR